MASSAPLSLLAISLLLLLLIGSPVVTAEYWSLLSLIPKIKHTNMMIDLKNYCESWRANVEVNNIGNFDVVPGECSAINGGYLNNGQYMSDVQRAVEEATVYLNDDVHLLHDGKDAWIFDVDETLLSTLPFYTNHYYGAENIDKALLESWMAEAKAPAIEHSLCLYRLIRSRGVKIFLIASRRESLREATVNNLVNEGFHGWTGLYLRPDNSKEDIQSYKASQRQALLKEGYRLWATVSSQWSSLYGNAAPRKIFKLPNPLYYEV